MSGNVYIGTQFLSLRVRWTWVVRFTCRLFYTQRGPVCYWTRGFL